MNTNDSIVLHIFYLLSPEDRRLLTVDIENKVMKRIINTPCHICLGTINIPVMMNSEIFCVDCGDISNCIACLHCVREWLQLNLPPNERHPVKHLLCDKTIDTIHLNAQRSYEIDDTLMYLLDKHYIDKVNCKCEFSGSRRQLLTHIKNGECTRSIWKCPACEFRGIYSKYILHTQNCKHIKNSMRF